MIVEALSGGTRETYSGGWGRDDQLRIPSPHTATGNSRIGLWHFVIVLGVIGATSILVAAVSAPVTAASSTAGSVEYDQHGPINLTVYATGTKVTEGTELIRKKNPKVKININSTETIKDVVVRVNGERRNAWHPNSTSYTVTDTVDTLNSRNDIKVVVRTESGAVETIGFEWLKDVLPPQLDFVEGGIEQHDDTDDDDDDDSFANNYLNASNDRFLFDRSTGTITAGFTDVDKVRNVQVTNKYTVNFAGSDQGYKKTYHTSRLNRTEDGTYTFSKQIYLAPSMGNQSVENTITIDVWDRIGNHESYEFKARVDDDRVPNASLSIDSFVKERDPTGDLNVHVTCIDRDDRYNNTTGDYYGGRYDGVPDCDDAGSNNTTSTLSWVRNVSDDQVARMPSNFVRMKGFLEDETRVRSLEYSVSYVEFVSGPNCGEINDSLDSIERSDFEVEENETLGGVDPDSLDYGNLSCDDLSDSLLRTLEQDELENVSDYQWDQFTGGTQLTDLREGEFVRDSQTGSGEDALRSVAVNEQLLLKQTRNRRVRHVLNLTAKDWAGHRTKLGAVIESNRINTDTEDPVINIYATKGPEPLTINATGTVQNGTVNSVSVETVDDTNNTILSHVDVYDGENTREPITINELLPRVAGPTTIVVRANDSGGETHVKRLGLKATTEGGEIVTRTPTPTPTLTTTLSPTETTRTPTTTQSSTSSPSSGTPTASPSGSPSPPPDSTPITGIAGDVTSLAGPGFGGMAAILALVATLFLVSRHRG